MKICVIGAGAIGGLLAARLAQSGQDVSIVERGAHLDAIRSQGLAVIGEDGSKTTVNLPSAEAISGQPRHDLYIVAVKAPDLPDVAVELRPLLTSTSMVMGTQNGIPWWYFIKHSGPYDGSRLQSTDPDGRLAEAIPANSIIASVVYPAATLVEPGVIQHVEGKRLAIGEIDNRKTDRAAMVSNLFRSAGFRAPVVSDIRTEIWIKLWGNMSFNPISALTHATMEDIASYPPTRELVTQLMHEAKLVAEKLGVVFPMTVEKRLSGAQSVGPHKTSMLQDVEYGRVLETDALIGSIIEIGRMSGVATPGSATIYPLLKLLSHQLQKRDRGIKID